MYSDVLTITQRKDKVMASTDRAQALHAELTQALGQLTTSEQWRRALDVAAKFHHYSWGNCMLIAMQRPDASRVAGYRKWQELGRQVRKGERGIYILAPCKVRNGTAYRVGDDGERTDEHATYAVVGFRSAVVFDIAQTDGDDLPDVRPDLLDGGAPAGLWDALADQVTAQGWTIAREDCSPANGRADMLAKVVTVRPDLSDAQACKTLAHELAHVLMGHDYATRVRSLCEVEAESVAYIVLRSQGVETDGYSLPYVAGWAGDTDALAKSAQAVVKVAHEIMSAIPARELVPA